MSAKDGGPAFPLTSDAVSFANRDLDMQGMSLRDYFAIHAPEPDADIVKIYLQADVQRDPHNDRGTRRGDREIRAMLRYQYADAMLKERAK